MTLHRKLRRTLSKFRGCELGQAPSWFVGVACLQLSEHGDAAQVVVDPGFVDEASLQEWREARKTVLGVEDRPECRAVPVGRVERTVFGQPSDLVGGGFGLGELPAESLECRAVEDDADVQVR